MLALELFEVDAAGATTEIGGGVVPPHLVFKADLARANCPELPLSGNSICDGACDFAQEVSARLTAHMMGLSEDMGDQFRISIHDFFELSITDPRS